MGRGSKATDNRDPMSRRKRSSKPTGANRSAATPAVAAARPVSDEQPPAAAPVTAVPVAPAPPPGLRLFTVQSLALAAGLIALDVAVFAQLRTHEFILMDDGLYITKNPAIQHGLTWAGVVWAFTTGHAANWHPLTWLSHMLDIQLFGLWAGGHHLTSVALHIVN